MFAEEGREVEEVVGVARGGGEVGGGGGHDADAAEEGLRVLRGFAIVVAVVGGEGGAAGASVVLLKELGAWSGLELIGVAGEADRGRGADVVLWWWWWLRLDGCC